jgi:hypothetical protein
MATETRTDRRTTMYDATGAPADSHAEAAVSPQATSRTACLELHNGNVTFVIEVEFDPNTYPYVITGGTITSGICGAPWDVTGGSMGPQLRLTARRTGSGSCADTFTAVGEYQVPPSWRGTYGFGGGSTSFTHTTVFRGYDTC